MIQVLGFRIAIDSPRYAEKLVGHIFIPDATKSTRNQTFHATKVLSSGAKVKQAVKDQVVVVSDLFGDDLVVAGQKLRIGRERDIVGTVTKDGIKPAAERVLLERIAHPEKVGSILLPDHMREPQFQATVIAAGPDCASVKPGDTVLVPHKQALEVRWEGKTYLLINEDTILAILC